MSVRRGLCAAAVALLGFVGPSPASAVAPCNETCHLAQGTPVLLVDTREIWLRACAGDDDEHQTCVAKRTRLDGTVLEKRAAPTLFDRDFHAKKLAQHDLVKLARKGPWSDLRQPLSLASAQDEMTTLLRLEGKTVVFHTPDKAPVRRSFPCEPTAVVVHAAGGKSLGAIVATARCPRAAGGTAEASVVFATAGEL